VTLSHVIRRECAAGLSPGAVLAWFHRLRDGVRFHGASHRRRRHQCAKRTVEAGGTFSARGSRQHRSHRTGRKSRGYDCAANRVSQRPSTERSTARASTRRKLIVGFGPHLRRWGAVRRSRLAVEREGADPTMTGKKWRLQQAHGMFTEEWAYDAERRRKGSPRSRVALQYFQHGLATRHDETSADNRHLRSSPRHPLPYAPPDMARQHLIALEQDAQRC
jgi:hypothetical protein